MVKVASTSETQVLVNLLNSWWITNDTRVTEDRLDGWFADHALWEQHLAGLPRPAELEPLRKCRDAIRQLVGGDPASFNLFLNGPTTVWTADQGGVRVDARTGQTATDLAIFWTVDMSQSGHLRRLKSCPDCRWVFIDASRNNSRVWCAMSAGPGRRGCGAIAKTQRYRQRTPSAASNV